MFILNLFNLTEWFMVVDTDTDSKPVIGNRSILGVFFPNLVTTRED